MHVAVMTLVSTLLAGHPCAEAVESRIEALGATSEILRAPRGPQGGPVYRVGTNRLGRWITLHLPVDGRASVLLSEPPKITRYDFDRSCAETVVTLPAPESPDHAFRDSDLERCLELNGDLVVYLWSPHLPLSVEGYAEVAAAAEDVGVPLVALADPGADRDYVHRAAREHGLPAGATRSLGSYELLFRDLAVHTPAVLVFHDRRASAPLPGYRPRAAYVEHFERILESGPGASRAP